VSCPVVDPVADSDLETASAEQIVAYAVERFGKGLALAASFQDCVLIDVAIRVRPDLEVVFLDTGFHFPETLTYVEAVRRRYQLRLTVIGRPTDTCPPCGQTGCCQQRKVHALDRALVGKHAWMSGLRRADSPHRAHTPAIGWDARRELIKVNPVARWSDLDVAAYSAEHELVAHPLAAAGFTSIGCQPTTRPVAPGAHPRSGRWPGTNKTECGLHL
jgi:phosphoadenosine phosphosulfate reductase